MVKVIRKQQLRPKRFEIYTQIFLRMMYYDYDSNNSIIKPEAWQSKDILFDKESVNIKGLVLREHIELPTTTNSDLAYMCNMKYSRKKDIFIGQCPYKTPSKQYTKWLHKKPLIELDKSPYHIQRMDGKGFQLKNPRLYGLKTDSLSKRFLRAWFEQFVFIYPASKKMKIYSEDEASMLRELYYDSPYHLDNIPENEKRALKIINDLKYFVERRETSGYQIIDHDDFIQLHEEVAELPSILNSFKRDGKRLGDVMHEFGITKKDTQWEAIQKLTNNTAWGRLLKEKEIIIKKLKLNPKDFETN